MSISDKEETGMELLRPLAQKLLLEPGRRDRVWSDHFEAWGFFTDRRERLDEFLFWCNAKVGDRFVVGSKSSPWTIWVILSISKDPDPKRLYWKMNMLTTQGKTVEFEIQESILFQSGWNSITA